MVVLHIDKAVTAVVEIQEASAAVQCAKAAPVALVEAEEACGQIEKAAALPSEKVDRQKKKQQQ